MTELAPGLSYWLAPHPDWEEGDNWPREVPCFRFESEDGIVFIDPLAPPTDERPDWILLTAPWHARDTARYPDTRVWAPPDAVWQGPSLTTTAELPAGVEVLLPEGDPNEALFYLRDQRALITGDAFSGTDGRFHVFIDDQEREPFVRSLRRLLELPIESVLVAHGPFVLDGATDALRAALEE